MPPAAPKQPHTLADHLLGALARHSHGDGDDHDHDHDAMDGLLAPGTSDQVVLTSIGVDIGSSGTQVAFARLHLERGSGERKSAARRETIYQSPVALTPYVAGNSIDAARLDRILDDAFAAAGLGADDIDCGVVILTGTARERANAEAITRRLADTCGDIVSASAGHHMEARLAAHGSGAVQRSAETGKCFLNIDIGGGTTKLAVCAAGEITATAALDIGGRLLVTDLERRIVRLEPAGARHAARAGLAWKIGAQAPAEEIERVAAQMADDLLAALALEPRPREVEALFVTEPLPLPGPVDGIIVSGGVGEYVYGRETRDFCDLGRVLGRAFARRLGAGALPWPLMPAAECIRATVLGASAYSVQLSGRTGYICDPARLLPRRNVQVLRPPFVAGETIDGTALARAIRAHLAAYDIATDREDLVLALRWQGPPEYPRLRALAEGIRDGLAERMAAGLALHIVVDGDIARSLGAILVDELGIASGVLVLDGIALADLDFVDLGRIRLPSGTVPVTIKTLVFRDEPMQKRRRRNGASGQGRTRR